jgi:serine/threonine protein kinase
MANRVGETLGKYKLIELLGKGGMAEVYKAYHEKLNRYVTIKILHSYLADGEDFLARFDREAKAVASLRHPHIVQIHDFDVEDDIYYMVMEYIDNGTLTQQIAAFNEENSTMPLEMVEKILQQLSSAMDYAHKKGFIHRDIKPSNILLDFKGDAFLTDFGIAHMISNTQFTATGSLIGTPSYMSPEQAIGDPLSPMSDIYSLGIVLYELLAGRTPFVSDTPIAIIHKHINEAPPRLRTIRKDISRGIDQILEKTLQKDPAKRYQSASELFYAFDAACRDLPTAVGDALKTTFEVHPPGQKDVKPDELDTEAPTEIMGQDTIAEITGKPSIKDMVEVAQPGKDLESDKSTNPVLAKTQEKKVEIPSTKKKSDQEKQIPLEYSKPKNNNWIVYSVIGLVVLAVLIVIGINLASGGSTEKCGNTDECIGLAFQFWDQGERDKALDTMQRAIDLVPPDAHQQYAWIWCDRGMFFEEMGDINEAEVSRNICQDWQNEP